MREFNVWSDLISFSELLVHDIAAQLNICSDARCSSSSQTTGLNILKLQELSEELQKKFQLLQFWKWEGETDASVKRGSEVYQGGDTKSPKIWLKKKVSFGSKKLQILRFWAHFWFQQGSVH